MGPWPGPHDEVLGLEADIDRLGAGGFDLEGDREALAQPIADLHLGQRDLRPSTGWRPTGLPNGGAVVLRDPGADNADAAIVNESPNGGPCAEEDPLVVPNNANGSLPVQKIEADSLTDG